jgi:hypothetical protein
VEQATNQQQLCTEVVGGTFLLSVGACLLSCTVSQPESSHSSSSVLFSEAKNLPRRSSVNRKEKEVDKNYANKRNVDYCLMRCDAV